MTNQEGRFVKYFYCQKFYSDLFIVMMVTGLLFNLQLFYCWASPTLSNNNTIINTTTISSTFPAINQTNVGNLDLLAKLDAHGHNHHRRSKDDDDDDGTKEETTTTLPYYLSKKPQTHQQHLTIASNHHNAIMNHSIYYENDSNDAEQPKKHHNHLQQQQQQSSRTDLYTVELTPSSHNHNHQVNGHNNNSNNDLHTNHPHQHQPRKAKHGDAVDDLVYNYKCPKQHLIHPCDCLELDKRAEMFEGSGDDVAGGLNNLPDDDINSNGTPTFEMIEEEPVHPDLIETVVLCKNIRNVQVLTEAIRGFQGHRVNFLVLDGCKLPPFPNNLFKGIHIVWMEILNSTMQFHDNFLQMRHCP